VKYYLIIDPGAKTYAVYILTGGKYIQQKNIPSFIIHGKCAVQLDIDRALAELGD
jgi:Uma2 family endonuclease